MKSETFRINDDSLPRFPAPRMFQTEMPQDLLGLKVRIDSCKSEIHTEALPCVCLWIGIEVTLTKIQMNELGSGYKFQASLGNITPILDRDQFEIIN